MKQRPVLDVRYPCLDLFQFCTASFSHLRVINADKGPVSNKAVCNINGRGLTSVARILLESETKDGDFLPTNRVEHGTYNPLQVTEQESKNVVSWPQDAFRVDIGTPTLWKIKMENDDSKSR
jgi:hypothetical protein